MSTHRLSPRARAFSQRIKSFLSTITKIFQVTHAFVRSLAVKENFQGAQQKDRSKIVKKTPTDEEQDAALQREQT